MVKVTESFLWGKEERKMRNEREINTDSSEMEVWEETCLKS